MKNLRKPAVLGLMIPMIPLVIVEDSVWKRSDNQDMALLLFSVLAIVMLPSNRSTGNGVDA